MLGSGSLLARASPFYPINAIEDIALSEDVIEVRVIIVVLCVVQ
jgi:hypothetical protein